MVAIRFLLADHCPVRPDCRAELVGQWHAERFPLRRTSPTRPSREESRDGGKARLRPLHASALLVATSAHRCALRPDRADHCSGALTQARAAPSREAVTARSTPALPLEALSSRDWARPGVDGTPRACSGVTQMSGTDRLLVRRTIRPVPVPLPGIERHPASAWASGHHEWSGLAAWLRRCPGVT